MQKAFSNCSSVNRWSLFICWFLYFRRSDVGCDGCFICTTNRFSGLFEFQKWLVWKASNLGVTKLLICLLWSSWKQSIRINSDSDLIFLTCSFLFPNTDSLVCVDLAFWKEPKKNFCLCFSGDFFSRCWAFCANLLFCCKPAALSTFLRSLPILEKILPWTETWKLSIDSPRVGSWSRMRPSFVVTS